MCLYVLHCSKSEFAETQTPRCVIYARRLSLPKMLWNIQGSFSLLFFLILIGEGRGLFLGPQLTEKLDNHHWREASFFFVFWFLSADSHQLDASDRWGQWPSRHRRGSRSPVWLRDIHDSGVCWASRGVSGPYENAALQRVITCVLAPPSFRMSVRTRRRWVWDNIAGN